MRQIQLTEWGRRKRSAQSKRTYPSPVRAVVLIKTVAAGVSPIDLTTRRVRGRRSITNPSYQAFVPGWDVAGTVVIPPATTGFKVGDGVVRGLVAFPPPPPVLTPSMFSPRHQLMVPAGVPFSVGGAPWRH